MTELNKEFIKETGFDIFSEIEDKYTVYTTEYVEWLEAKINYTPCCTELPSEQEVIKQLTKIYNNRIDKQIENFLNLPTTDNKLTGFFNDEEKPD